METNTQEQPNQVQSENTSTTNKPTPIDIKTISTVELKSLAYDLNILLGRTQQNLKVVVDELNTRG